MGFTDHPFHPAVVHFPIAFLTFAHVVDMIHYLTMVIKAPVITPFAAPFFPQVLATARLVHTVGVATGLLAVVTGVQQAGALAANPKNIFEADGKTLKPKMYVMAAHAGLNDICLIISGLSCYWRYKEAGVFGEVAPSGWDYIISFLILPVFYYAASLGGDLVFKYGMGFSTGRAAQKKEQ